MSYPLDDYEKATERLRRADAKLTETMRWVVYESRGFGADDHSESTVEAAPHAAPSRVTDILARQDTNRKWRNRVFWFVFWSAVGFFAWLVTR